MNSPTPDEITKLRKSVLITQTEAGELIYKSLRTWQQWEYGERTMDPAFWELFKIKIAMELLPADRAKRLVDKRLKK